MSTHTLALSKLDAAEEKILRLIPLQNELRTVAAEYLSNNKMTINEFAARCGGVWKEAKQFLEGTRALGRGRFLMGLSLFLSQEDLCEKIEKEVADLQDRQISTSLFPENVVRTLFKVLRAHARRGDTVTRAVFAQAFNPNHETVLGLFDLSHTALNQLRHTATRESVDLLVENNGALDTEIETQLQKYQHRINDLVGIVERLSRALLPYYQGQYKFLAEGLGIPTTTFQTARQGSASEAYIIDLIEKMRALTKLNGIGEHMAESRSTEKNIVAHTFSEKPKEKADPVKETSLQNPVGHEKSVEAGGVTASDGTRYCITAADLDALSLQNADEYITWTRQVLERARWALNLGTQLKDPVMRKKIRGALSKETRELYLSLQAFEIEYPGVIAPLLDAQRKTFLGSG